MVYRKSFRLLAKTAGSLLFVIQQFYKGMYYMAKEVIVNRTATIKNGLLKGWMGKIVAYDWLENKVVIKLDDFVNIETKSENIEQDMT